MNDRKRHWRAGCIWVAAVFLLGGMLLLQAAPAAAEPPRFAAVLAGMKAKLAATSDQLAWFCSPHDMVTLAAPALSEVAAPVQVPDWLQRSLWVASAVIAPPLR